MEAEEKKKRGQRGRITTDDLEMKLEEFYNSLEEEEQADKLEDIRRLARESKELLRKVDALVELLIRAAQEEDEDDYGAILTEISSGVSEIEERLKRLEDLDRKLDSVPPEFEKLQSAIEELKTFVSSSVSQSLSSITPKIDKMSEILPSISERMDLLSKHAEKLDKLDKLDGLDDIYRKSSELYDQIVSLKSAVDSALDAQTKLLSRRLAAVYKRVMALEGSIESLSQAEDAVRKGVEETREAISKLPELSSELEEIKAKLAEIGETLKAIDDLRARMDTLVVSMDHVPKNVESALDEKLGELSSQLDAVSDTIASTLEDRTRQIISRIDEVDEKLSEIDELRAELAEVKTLVSDRSKDKEWFEHQFELLEKEMESLNLAIDAMNKALAGSLDERKEAIQKLASRTEKILKTLHQMQTLASKEQGERISKLQQTIQDMFSNLSQTVEQISSQEAEERKVFQDYVAHLDERLSSLEKALEGDVTKSELSAMREELDEISKRLLAVTDLMHKNTALLRDHSGDVVDLLARFQSLEQRLTKMESEIQSAPQKLVESHRQLEKEIDELREQVSAAARDLRSHRDSEVVKSIQALRETLSVIHSELLGLLELIKKYDTTSKLAELSKRLDEIHASVKAGNADHASMNRELADIEEQLAQISNLLSESDVKSIRSKLEDVYRTVDSIADSVKNARAILDENELKEILHDMEALRAYAREVREAGLVDELDELRSRIKKLRALVESEVSAIREGKVHHRVILDHHSDAKRLVIPVMSAASNVKTVARAKEEHAKRLKALAKSLADETGSTHAHMIASHSDRIIRTAKAMKDIERLVKKIQRRVEDVEAHAGQRSGSSARRELQKIVTRDLVNAASAQIAKIVKKMKRGEIRTSDQLAEELGVREDVVKKALDRIARTGELAVKVKKPLLPFLGGHYTVIRL